MAGKPTLIYWGMRQDAADLWLWFLSKVPGLVGRHLREWALPRILAGCGEDNNFHINFRVNNAKHLKIGSHCSFGQGVYINAGGGVKIGDYVGLGPDAKIWSVNHRFEDPDVPWMKQGYEHKEVVIEDDVWIGAGAFLMPGVTIGKGAIISAGTVLAKSVPAYAIVAGNPGRVVGWRKSSAPAAGGDAADRPKGAPAEQGG